MNADEKIAEVRKQLDPDGYVSFDVCPGWTDLVWKCHSKLLDVVPNYKLVQVKEKFGGLCFYYTTTSTTDADRDRAREIVRFYEKMSYETCDECGTTVDVSTGTLDGGKFGWVRTMCEPCRLQEILDHLETPKSWELTDAEE